MTSNKQSEIFYSEESSDDENEPQAPGDHGDNESVVLAKPSRQGTVNLEPNTSGDGVQDDSIGHDNGAEPLASGSRKDESNLAVILGRPKVGEPAVWRGAIDLGPDTPGEKGEDGQPTTPAHQVTDMFLFEVLAKMFVRSQIKLEMRVMTLEDRLRERDQDTRIMRQELVNMRNQLAEDTGTTLPTASGRHSSCPRSWTTFLELDKLEKRVSSLSSQLTQAKMLIGTMSLQISKMQARVARAPITQPHPAGPVQPFAGASHCTTPTPWKGGGRNGYSCYLCNVLVGDHSTDFCYKNPQRLTRPTPSGRGRAKL